MFGYAPDELIGMPGEMVYPSRESYLALGQIATPMLSAGRQLDLEWEMRRKDGSTFLVPHDRQGDRPGQHAAGHGVDRRGHHRAAAPRRRDGAPAARAGGDPRHRVDRHRVRQGPPHRALQPALRGDVRLRRRASSTASRPRCSTPARKSYERAESVYEALARGETARRVELRRRKDGSTFWNRADGRAVDPQNPHKGSVWTVEDVTEQRRAEDELQRVLAEQQALLDNVVVGIAISRERKMVRCNRRFEEMFGFAAGEAIGASWRQMYFTEEEFELRAQVYAELDQGRTHAREQWLRRQDGSGFWCRVSGRAVAAGDPRGATSG